MEKNLPVDLFEKLINPRDPLAIVRAFISNGNTELAKTMSDRVDFLKYGGDLLHLAVKHGRSELVEHFLQKGANIMNPPETVQGNEEYRKTPFSIQASEAGDQATFDLIMSSGGSLLDCGPIGFSKKRKNMVISNVIGSLAFNARTRMLS